MDKILKKDRNKIIFSDDFNSPLTEEILHELKNVKKIVFGISFNQLIDNLPNNIRTIELGEYFNKPIDNLPIGLKKLIIGGCFHQQLDFLPQSLEHLEFSSDAIYYHPLDNLPRNLKILQLHGYYQLNIDNLPDSIEEITIGIIYYPINRISRFYDGMEIDDSVLFNMKIDKFPKKLKTFTIFEKYLYIDELKERLGEKLIIV